MDKSKGKKIESDSSSSSDDEDSNHNAENGDTRNGVCSRLLNWLSVILCCFGGDVRRTTLNVWVLDAPAHGKGGMRKLIKKIIKNQPPKDPNPPPPPPNSGG